MNKAAQELAMQLAQKEYSMIEYRNRLVRMQNMGLICHCSAEIDMGTLLYFSVNDMYLGKGTFVVILFSEVSSNTEDQDLGRDVFSRTFTYAIIEEAAREAFTGHYAFYSSELDASTSRSVLCRTPLSSIIWMWPAPRSAGAAGSATT